MKRNSKSSATRSKPSTPSPRSSKKAAPSIPKLNLQKDLADFVASCLSHKVEFLIVGGYAVALHGYPRFTKDIDLLIACSLKNAERIECVLREFGVPESEVARADILKPGYAIQVGRPPNRVDLLTSISGVDWDAAWASKIQIKLSGQKCWMIGRDLLIQNKRASARPQDLVDVDNLSSSRSDH
jgi:hypothetical protein